MLSVRLGSLYEHCLPGLPMWDMCCDHGQLGLWALHSGRHPRVYFNDIVPHVLEKLPARFGERSIAAEIVLGAAETIAGPLTGSVVIAGVGGEKIIAILQSHAARGSLQAERIAVCPEKDADWMLEQDVAGYTLVVQKEIQHGEGKRLIAVYHRKADQTRVVPTHQ